MKPDHDIPVPHIGECSGDLEQRQKNVAYTIKGITFLVDLWTCACYGHGHVQSPEAGGGTCIQLIQIEGTDDTVDGRMMTFGIRLIVGIQNHIAPRIEQKRMAAASAARLN